MNSGVNRQRILLIDATDATIADLCQKIKNLHEDLAGCDIATAVETDAVGYLNQTVAAGKPPAVVLVGPHVCNVATLTREMQRLKISSHLIFIAAPESTNDVQQSLHHIPMAGLKWVTADIGDPTFAGTVLTAVQAALQLGRFRATRDQANQQLNAYHAADKLRQSRSTISEYYLASFLAHAQDAIVAMDPDFRVLYWSAGAERLFGRSDEETVGVIADVLPFWSPRLQQHLSRLHHETGALITESALVVGDDKLVIEIACSAVRDETGSFVGSSLIIRDITERSRKIEAERAERKKITRVIDSERRHLRSLFKQAPGFIAVTTGPDHIFDVVNDAYLQIMGERAILGKPVTEALPEMQDQGFLQLLNQVYASGEPYVGRGMTVSLQRDPGAAMETLFIDFVFQPIVEEDGTVTGIFCQGNDVTQHKLTKEKLALHQTQLEQLVRTRTAELETSQQALQRSQKLEAIGQLTGGVAHDFNNVLQIISSNLQLLQIGSGNESQKKRFVGAAIDAVDRGTKLSSQLLAFARRQPLQPIALNLSRVLRGMDDLLRRALGETIEIETIVAGGLWTTMVDPNQLENVILNLAINARDAMPEGGRLTLELGNAMLDDRYVASQPDVPAGQYVLLAVSDTGSGMTSEIIERAFDPFFTTKREGTGTGLGLSMAYGFVKQSGGHIRIYSEPDSGTTFKIYLPRCFESEVETPRFSAGPVVGGSETVLVVEDDPAVQNAAVLILRELGYKVLRASDGQSALNVLQSGVVVDVLFTDVVMPGPVRSPDLARQAEQILPDIAVLFTSGYTQNAIVHSGRLDPGVELLNKPYRREDLARKIRHVLAHARQKRVPVTLETPSQKAPSSEAVPLRILVVEDDSDSLDALRNLLTVLGHQASGVASAEAALDSLANTQFDLLLTDVNLPRKSGLELVNEALQLQPQLDVIIASGYGPVVEQGLAASPIVLPKPFDLQDLRRALATVQKND